MSKKQEIQETMWSLSSILNSHGVGLILHRSFIPTAVRLYHTQTGEILFKNACTLLSFPLRFMHI